MDAATRAADVTGQALGLVFGVVSRVRPADKPMHPAGSIAHGCLTRTGAAEPTGVAWLDGAGTEDIFVRVSRGAGLPRMLPDVPGLAVRVYLDGGRLADLLFSATGSGPSTRYLFRPARDLSSGRLSTLMPYRTPRGARLLGVQARIQDGCLVGEVSVAAARGPWQSFATFATAALEPEGERQSSFDSFLNTVPGLAPYEWIQLLRQRSYAAARGSRGARVPQHVDEPTARP